MKNRKLFYFTIFLISLMLIFVVYPFSSQSTFYGDDGIFALYNEEEKLFDILGFNYGHGSGYLGAFINKFLCFKLPNILGIHPQEFINTWHNIIKGIFIAIVLLSITKFANIFTKSKMCFLLIYLFVIGYFLCATLSNGILEINYSFYRYFFSLLFFSGFWFYIYKNILVKYKQTNYLNLILASFCGYVLGTSTEISFFLSAFLLILLIGYNLIMGIYSKIAQKDINFLKYNLDKRFYIPSFFLFVAIFLFTTNEGFKQIASDRGMANISISQDTLVEFWNLYINSCFSSLTIYWIIFTVLMIISFIFAIRKNEIKKVIFPLLLQFSILIIMFSLVLCGKTYDEITRDRFYLHHVNIIFLYKMLILYPLLICFNYVLKNVRKHIKKALPILILITFISYGIFVYTKIPSFNKKSISYYKEFNELRRNFYISEKMLRFYALKNETAILDKEIVTNYCHIWILFGEENNYKYTKIISSYYPRIYGQNIKELGFKLEENAIEKFKKNGGSITEEELNNLDFSRLFDEDFVLNKKI